MTAPTPNSMPGAQLPESLAATEPPAAPQTAPLAATEAPAAPEAPKPPWGDDADFDPSRAWSLIQNLRSENAEFKTKAQPILDEHERLRQASQSELDRAREELGTTAERETAWRNRAVTAEAKALAADKFIDSDTVLALVGDLSGFVDGDNIDTSRLQQRLDQLAADKPFLVKQPSPQGFTPNRGQGQSGTGQIPVDAQIKAAQERGDLMTSIALKQQQHYAKK